MDKSKGGNVIKRPIVKRVVRIPPELANLNPENERNGWHII